MNKKGKRRHHLAFAPFFGGKRVCIGKTFAETVSRIVGPALLGSFDFSFVRGEKRPDVSLVQVKEPIVMV